MDPKTRLDNEIEKGRILSKKDVEKAWGWRTPAGRIRRKRRSEMLSSHLNPDGIYLEIGCGTGLFTIEFAKTAAKIIISPLWLLTVL